MAVEHRTQVLTDAEWDGLQPLIEDCRRRGKTQPHALRRTIAAIIWRHDNGAKGRAIPPDLGPWWMAAQTVIRHPASGIRWSRLGVWERLLERAQERGVALGMVVLDGTNVRAHAKAAGASKKGALQRSGT